MATLESGNILDVKDGEYPLYEQEDLVKKVASELPQGQGSRTDSDTVDGLQAVTATKAGPNKLVATGSDGLLPSSILPTAWTSSSRQTLTAQTSVTFSSLSPSNMYRLSFRMRQNTSNGRPYVQFNADTGNNYDWLVGVEVSSPTHGSGEGVATDRIYFANAGRSPVTGSYYVGSLIIACDPSDSTRIGVIGTMMNNSNASEDRTTLWTISGRYDGASALTSILFGTSGGTFTGDVVLEQFSV